MALATLVTENNIENDSEVMLRASRFGCFQIPSKPAKEVLATLARSKNLMQVWRNDPYTGSERASLCSESNNAYPAEQCSTANSFNVDRSVEEDP
jgi:hypothetical protein